MNVNSVRGSVSWLGIQSREVISRHRRVQQLGLIRRVSIDRLMGCGKRRRVAFAAAFWLQSAPSRPAPFLRSPEEAVI